MSNGPIRITESEFKKLGGLIYDNFGINLTSEKKQLLEGRFQRVLQKNNHRNFQDYIHFLYSDPAKKMERLGELVDRISTNHTFFWREPKHFELLEKEWLPELIKRNAKSKKIRIWCAAASTGEEPYTLLGILLKVLGANYKSWDTGVLATDISSTALSAAVSGLYDTSDIEALPKVLQSILFQSAPNSKSIIKDSIRSEILFRRFNLMNPLPFKGTFDIVFCRNVMIYFDKETTHSLVNRIYNKVTPGGYLVISLSESLNREKMPFKYIAPGIYQKI